MAFASSSADFGIKSSAPGQAQGFSEQQHQPSLFGGGQTTQNPFNQNTTQPSMSNSTFGQSNPSQQPATLGGTNVFGLWGANTPNNASTNTGTTWGQSATQSQSQPAPPLDGNTFGNLTQQSQGFQASPFGGGASNFGSVNGQQPPGQGSSLFPGSLGFNNAQNPTQQSTTGFSSLGTSAFGTASQQQQQQQPSTGGTSTGLFPARPTFSSSFNQFGNTHTPLGQPAGASLWGNSLNSNNTQSTFGQPASSAAVQGQQQPPVPFTRNTRFNDLPESVQKIFETIDTHIQGRIQISRALKSRSLADEPTKAAETLRRVHNDLVNAITVQQSDRSIVEEIRSKVDQCVQDTIITTRIIDGFKNPQQNGIHLKNHATFPLEFFSRAAEEIRQKLLWYKSTIEQIERRLVSAQSQVHYTPQVISSTLQAQNTSFLALAARTAEVDTELQELKNQYRELWKAQTGSARDPFNELDRRPGDSEGLLNGMGNFSLNR